MHLPSQIEDIDSAWLALALSDGGWNDGMEGCSVDSVTVERFGEGTAFLGSLARLRPNYTPGTPVGPPSIVAKLPSSEPGAQAVGRMLNVWTREAMFYAHIAPGLPADVEVPTCRFNFVDQSNRRSVLLLDDATPAIAGDQLQGATADEARAAVAALARFHSTWWGKERTAELAWVPGIDRPGAGAGLRAAMSNSLDQFETQFGELLPSASMDWNRRFIPRVDTFLSKLATRPMTIAHADYRLENLLFHPAGNVMIIDWQTAMYTGGVTDLSFLLGTSLDTELRRTLEDDLLDIYLDELIAFGVDPSLLVDVRADYRASMLWWMAILGNNLATIETPDDRSAELFLTMLTRVHSAAIDLRSGEFLAD